jgi:hypothetical protein
LNLKPNHPWTLFSGIKEMSALKNIPPSIYLAGASWGSAFYIGVYRRLQQEWGEDFGRHCTIAGDSAGALMAVGMSLGLPWEDLQTIYCRLALQAADNGVMLRMSEYHDKALDSIFRNHPTAHQDVSGRLFVGVTTFFSTHRWHSEWSSNSTLRDTLHGSFHIPYYCTVIRRVDSKIVCDGSLSMLHSGLLPHGEETLCVDVADTGSWAELRCQPALSLKDCTQPFLALDYEMIRDRGYQETEQWLQNGAQILSPKHRRFSNRFRRIAMLVGAWPLRVSESLLLR